ncbi:MAG: hypothetical protein ACJ74U_04210 [Jatrophihabitantaceae bacterium]
MSRCSTTSGVVVAVDFEHWGGPLVRSCGSTPTTGYQLVNQGGLATTGTKHDGPGFICRIGYSGFAGGAGYPTDQSCIYTPPSSASWSYWTAGPTDTSWILSPKGAGDSHPVDGAVQAWTFGGGSPAFSPDSVRAHNSPPASSAGRTSSHVSSPPASRPAASPTGQPAGPGGSTGSRTAVASAGHASRPATGSAANSSAAPDGSSAQITAGTLTAGAPPSSGPKIVDATPSPAAARGTGAGSYLPELAGGGIVLALGGLAGFTAWQRRRAG